MIDYGRIARRARALASASTNPEVQELADLIHKLAELCEQANKTAEEAKRDAQIAKRNSGGHLATNCRTSPVASELSRYRGFFCAV